MRLLVDTDAFCKLAAGGFLNDSTRLLGARLALSSRLPALPHMLRRGSLRETYGPKLCDALIQVSTSMPTVEPSGDRWLRRLAVIPDIDPGDALLLATTAEADVLLLTGDKRSLRAIKNIHGFPEVLSGRIIVLEAMLIELCGRLGTEEVQRRAPSLSKYDAVTRICFSELNSEPVRCLRSYFEALAEEVSPLVLWKPHRNTLP